ncbi:MAG: hypothetical protein JO339_38225, partial [Alphaproteobacteria bacterium]|nr:hypothetical protein [Alphaproteobacteria bacterium]
MWEWLKKLWEDPTQNYVAAYLAGREGDDDGQPKEIEEGKDYFTITLECMRLVNVREGLTKFYGVLSGTVGCDLETRQETITVIVSPEALKGVEKPKLAKVIVQSVPICERVPYSGGPIDLRLALL